MPLWLLQHFKIWYSAGCAVRPAFAKKLRRINFVHRFAFVVSPLSWVLKFDVSPYFYFRIYIITITNVKTRSYIKKFHKNYHFLSKTREICPWRVVWYPPTRDLLRLTPHLQTFKIWIKMKVRGWPKMPFLEHFIPLSAQQKAEQKNLRCSITPL